MAITGSDFLLTPVRNFPYIMRPLTNITPFTYEDGTTYLEILTLLDTYIRKMGPDVDVKLKELFEEFQKGITNAENTIIKEREEWKKLFDDFMADIVVQLEALNDQAVANLVNRPESKLSGALNSKFVGKDTIFINVKDHGAKGDGVTNDQAAIQVAMNIARDATSSSVVVFPDGEYNVPHVVDIYSNTTLLGIGDAWLIKKLGSTATTVFGIRSFGNKGYGSGANNVVIRNLKFRGDFANNRGVAGLGANHASNILIEDCIFDQCMVKNHVFDMGGCENITWRNCTFRGSKYATAADRYNECIQLDNSARSGSSYLDLPGSYDGLPCRNIVVDNCKFLPLTLDGVTYPAPTPFGSHYGVEGKYQENVRFTNNLISGFASDTSSTFKGLIHLVAMRNVEISGNTFDNTLGSAINAIRFINLTSSISPVDFDNSTFTPYPLTVSMSSHSVKILNNHFKGFNNLNTLHEIISVYGGSNPLGKASEVIVSGNSFENCAVDGISGTGANHVQLTHCKNIVVSNNVCDMARRIVYFATVEDVIISGNRGEHLAVGFAINGVNGSGVTIVDNVLNDYSGGIYVDNSNNVSVRGNILENQRSTSEIGIDIASGSNIIVSSNIVTGANNNGVRIKSECANGIVSNNIVSGKVLPISIGSGATNIIEGENVVI